METSKVQFLNECKIKFIHIKEKNKTQQTFEKLLPSFVNDAHLSNTMFKHFLWTFLARELWVIND